MIKEKEKNIDKLELLITIIDREEDSKYISYYQKCGVVYQSTILGRGTANSNILDLLGLTGSDKQVILSLMTSEKVAEIMKHLKSDLKIHGKGIAFSVSLTSIIGRNIYNFIVDNRNLGGI